MKKQLGMFDMLSEECSACDKPFDKKSKEDVATWSVVVREKEKIVRLYCPSCWAGASKFIQEVQDDFRIQEESRHEGPDSGKS